MAAPAVKDQKPAPAEDKPAAAPAPDLKVVTEPPRVQAPDHSIKLAEHGRNLWYVIAPADHTLEQAMDLRYCWHRHEQIKPGDWIEIRHSLFHYHIDILVTEIDKEAMSILGYYTVRDLTKEELRVPDLDGAYTEELGALKWVIRLGTRVLKSGFDTKLEADAWLKKKQARA